jgi:Flp pilus assembly pilin Flp
MKTNSLMTKPIIRGQGMTEYIIIVALIAVAAIGTYSYFGKTVRNQSGAMAAALGGDDTGAKAANKAGLDAGKDAAKTAQDNTNLQDFSKNTGVK